MRRASSETSSRWWHVSFPSWQVVPDSWTSWFRSSRAIHSLRPATLQRNRWFPRTAPTSGACHPFAGWTPNGCCCLWSSCAVKVPFILAAEYKTSSILVFILSMSIFNSFWLSLLNWGRSAPSSEWSLPRLRTPPLISEGNTRNAVPAHWRCESAPRAHSAGRYRCRNFRPLQVNTRRQRNRWSQNKLWGPQSIGF